MSILTDVLQHESNISFNVNYIFQHLKPEFSENLSPDVVERLLNNLDLQFKNIASDFDHQNNVIDDVSIFDALDASLNFLKRKNDEIDDTLDNLDHQAELIKLQVNI